MKKAWQREPQYSRWVDLALPLLDANPARVSSRILPERWLNDPSDLAAKMKKERPKAMLR